MKTSQLRQAFLDFFEGHDHTKVASSSLVPENDPTLLFTNAGMVQFKRTFLGLEKRSYHRAVTSQRCVRAGGKHNDLDNVGYTARHHTFFEMLGNFSFGDYFKREAIRYAWTFLTEILKLPADKLWITVFREDDEAADIWLKEIGIDPQRFSRCGEVDNFWSMGETGPCGPCTEIFYDHGPSVAGGPPGSPDADGDRYIEIWNLVFMQFERDAQGQMTPLPKPSVDTGMGLERIAAVMQGVKSNYDIDIFQQLITAVKLLVSHDNDNNVSLKVIADHIRSCTFLIIDGVLPSNEGRGYVLRRIIRRAIRHGQRLGVSGEPFFYKLVPALIAVMGEAYPILSEQKVHIQQVLQAEELQFLQTLTQGIQAFEQVMAQLSSDCIDGEIAFKLYDTYGFPLDLTVDMARERQLTVDIEGFDNAMQRQRSLSQQANKFVSLKGSKQLLETHSVFNGYTTTAGESEVLNLLDQQQASVDRLTANDSKVGVVLAETPFYAESGGQIGDVGTLSAIGVAFEVEDTQKSGDAIVHWGRLQKGSIGVGDQLQAQVDEQRRQAIRCHHSATHLVHAALRQILGDHVQQMGSLVGPDKARFDFSHPHALDSEQCQAIEVLINAQIRLNHPVQTDLMSVDQAKAAGAMALFGEKYGDEVRVLTMGDFSKELCGGTHVSRTGDIGFCCIIAESGIASGTRRLEFCAGQSAVSYYHTLQDRQSQLAQQFKVSIEQLPEKTQALQEQLRACEKTIETLKQQQASGLAQSLASSVTCYHEKIAMLVAEVGNVEMPMLRQVMDVFSSRWPQVAVVLVAVQAEKIQVVAKISPSLVALGLDARKLVKQICGRGGGRAEMAQGGGQNSPNLQHSLEAVRQEIETFLASSG